MSRATEHLDEMIAGIDTVIGADKGRGVGVLEMLEGEGPHDPDKDEARSLTQAQYLHVLYQLIAFGEAVLADPTADYLRGRAQVHVFQGRRHGRNEMVRNLLLEGYLQLSSEQSHGRITGITDA